MPDFLCDELKDYISRLYGLLPTDRIFHLTKSFLHHEMTRGAEKAGVKRIRIHDLRHSHISLLISMGFSAVSIGNRVGHESVDITYRYAHMFPTEQTKMAKLLNEEFKEGMEEWVVHTNIQQSAFVFLPENVRKLKRKFLSVV